MSRGTLERRFGHASSSAAADAAAAAQRTILLGTHVNTKYQFYVSRCHTLRVMTYATRRVTLCRPTFSLHLGLQLIFLNTGLAFIPKNEACKPKALN